MKMLSTGQESTLANYLILATGFFGEDSGAVKFLRDKIAASPNGPDEEVLADEAQMVLLLSNLALRDVE